MKKIILTLLPIIIVTTAWSQNSFPTTGNAGIGTTNPSSKLSIRNVGGVDGVKLLDFSENLTEEFLFKGNFLGSGGEGNKLILGTGIGTTGWEPNIMTWRGNGNVGVGSISPEAKLDITSSGAHYNSTPSLRIRDVSYRGTVVIESVADEPTDFIFKNNDRLSWDISARGSTDNYSLKFYPSQNGTTWFVPTMTLLTSGRVGVGTGNPEAKLEVSSSGAHYTGTPSLAIKDDSNRGTLVLESAADHPTDFVFKNNDRLSWDISARGSADNYSLNFYPSTNGSAWFTSTLTLLTNGYVGIGTNDPKNKLSVNGTIWAKEVKVSLTDGADWVFEDDYQLRTLEEVEEFVKENKHLPEIPSAEEFRQNDLNVAEMDNMLLQKIEELTLYMIEQNKRMNRLEARNSELENELFILKKE